MTHLDEARLSMNPQDAITIRHEALATHERTKDVLASGGTDDLEQQRDDCIEKMNAVNKIIDTCEDQKDGLRKQKRELDDQIAEINKVQREFEGYRQDLNLDQKRCNNAFWEMRKQKKTHDSYPA